MVFYYSLHHVNLCSARTAAYTAREAEKTCFGEKEHPGAFQPNEPPFTLLVLDKVSFCIVKNLMSDH
jgi:hypothetical protein